MNPNQILELHTKTLTPSMDVIILCNYTTVPYVVAIEQLVIADV